MRLTAWCRQHWGPERSLSRGLVVLGAAFVPMLAVESLLLFTDVGSRAATVLGVGGLLATAAALAIGTAIVLPFEMSTIVGLARNRLVATHYGFYNTVCGVGILLGNVGTGWAIDLARSAGLAPAPWAVMLLLGLLCAAALAVLRRRGLLTAHTDSDDPRPDAEALTVRLPAIDGWAEQSVPTRPLPARVEPRLARTMRPVRITAAARTEHDEPSSPRGRHARRE